MAWWKKNADDFSNKVVLITGGSRGIGFVTAKLFVEQGACVGICSKDKETLLRAERKLGQTDKVEATGVDVRDATSCQRFVEKVKSRFGGIDILVNNAGKLWVGPFEKQNIESIEEIIDVNVKGVLFAAHAVLPTMKAQGYGVIVNISSGAGLSGIPEIVTYCTSKFGVVGFTESLAREADQYGVRVYGICPGRVATDMQVEYAGKRVGMPPAKVAGKILTLAGANPPVKTGRCLVISS